MSYKIEKRIIPGLPNIPLTASRFIVAHESGNPRNTGPNALQNEIDFMTKNFRNAFTSHWVGGGGRIVQLALTGRLQYGAGPKANPYSWAHVELARTSNRETFKKDYAAYIWLLRYLADQAGIPKRFDEGGPTTKGIKSHDWIRRNLGGTTHTDPFGYLASHGISKAQFKRDVENGLGGSSKPTPPKKATSAAFSGTYKVVKTVKGYVNAADAKARRNQKTTVKPGTYHVFNRSNGMINVSARKDVPGSWINPADNKAAAKTSTKKKLHLPASASSWTIYKINRPAVKANKANWAGQLNPKKFGGLTYDILGNPEPYVYIIQTRDFGKVKIYAAPSTGAKIK